MVESSRYLPVIRGRGASWNPRNRFERLSVDREEWTHAEDPPPSTEILEDRTRSILSHNEAPDVGFSAGLNPYRGCEHACIYCYARPTHEYLGFSAGLDFETKIVAKPDAPRLLRKELSARGWVPKVVGFSGVTDAYQPVERRLGITRACLEVLAEFRNPVSIITKSHLVTRDADLLAELAKHEAAAVSLSLATLRPELQRIMEPRANTPLKRLDAIRSISESGIPVGVSVAPVIPGLTDHEVPAILEAAGEAGASFAWYTLLRLPHAVKDLFSAWLEQHLPDRRDKVLNRMREMRGGALYDSRYAVRGSGEGEWADQLRSIFRVSRRRAGLGPAPELSAAAFRRPDGEDGGQGELFGE